MTATALRDISDDALADLYGKVSHDDQAARIVLAEAQRRERLERAEATRKAEREEWEMMAWAQYEAAEKECCGQLIRHANRDRHEFREAAPRPRKLNADADDPAEIEARRVLCAQCGHPLRHPWHEGVSPFILWENGEEWARKYGSEELCAFWDHSPRVTVTQWQQAHRDGRRIQQDERDAAQDTTEGATMIDARRETATDQPSLVAKYQQMGAKKAVALREQSAVVRRVRPVDGAQTLEYARRSCAHFAVWPSEAALTTATLWAAHAHARDAKKALVFLSTPRLLFSSAEPGAGKSTP